MTKRSERNVIRKERKWPGVSGEGRDEQTNRVSVFHSLRSSFVSLRLASGHVATLRYACDRSLRAHFVPFPLRGVC